MVSTAIERSIDVTNDAPGHQFLVGFPVFAVSESLLEKMVQKKILDILFFACFVVAPLAVDEEDGKVDDIVVGDGCFKLGWKRPGKGHDDVTAECSRESVVTSGGGETYK